MRTVLTGYNLRTVMQNSTTLGIARKLYPLAL